MLNPNFFENSRPDGLGVLEIVGSGSRTPGEPRRFVPLKVTTVAGNVVGPLADLRLKQVYGYTKDQCDLVLEAIYRFPLPGDAAVVGVRVRFGETEITAELKEREVAEAKYQEAKQTGRQAALLTREAPSVFTLHVAGLQPGQEISVETHYLQQARPQGVGWSLRIPLTTPPRYVRGDEAGTRSAEGQPLLVFRDPGHRFSLDLVFDGAAKVESPTHALTVAQEGHHARVRLQAGETIPDQDCVLSWKAAREEKLPSLQVFLHDDPADEHVYFLALITPPSVPEPGCKVPREVVLLVDHSGSMEGPKWRAADWAVKRFLMGLNADDAFALGVFHDRTRWHSRMLQPAGTATVAEAIRFLEEHRERGGTELGVALEQALNLNRAPGERARHVLLITDAQVSDEGRILGLAEAEAERAERRRVSVLCIDAAPNSFLVHEIAERGGGIARFLTSDPREDDITTALDEVLAEWSEALWGGLRLEVNRAGLQTSGRQTTIAAQPGWSAVDLGNLPAGRTLWLTGRFPRGATGSLALRLVTGTGLELARYQPLVPEESSMLAGLKTLFGARRVQELEFLIHSGRPAGELAPRLRRLGYDPEQMLPGHSNRPAKVYPNSLQGELLRPLLVREALAHGLACSETAFVAVRKERGQRVEGIVHVANAQAKGWANSIMYGSTGYHQPKPRVQLVQSLDLWGVPPDATPDSQAILDMLSSPETQGLGNLQFRSVMYSPVSPGAGPLPVEGEDSLKPQEVFAGTPQFSGAIAVLFDSRRTEGGTQLAARTILSRLRLRIIGPTPAPASLDPGLCLLIFVDDLTAPRARVGMADLILQGGDRPLNLQVEPGQAVRLVLSDPAGAWVGNPPHLEVALIWEERPY